MLGRHVGEPPVARWSGRAGREAVRSIPDSRSGTGRAARAKVGSCVVAGLLLLAIGSTGSGRGDAAERPRTNLLLVTLDTVRADRLGCYGYREAATPALDRLASEGALFELAESVAPLTLPAHASILTAQYPPRHGVRDNSDYRLPASAWTLAEHCAARGYHTAAVVGSVILSAAQGLDQGFAAYDEPRGKPAPGLLGTNVLYSPIVERPAEAVTGAALSLLPAEPFFLWVHYFDAHADYSPPSPFKERFATRPYDGEIAYVDSQLGRLLDALRAKGILSRTLVVVVGDHGESLGEHGEATHGILTYDATLRVPLLMRLPGAVPAGRRVRDLVSEVDVAPTVTELLGLPRMESAEGRSFAAVARGGKLPPREPAYSETIYGERAYGWAPLRSLRDATRRFIDAPEPEIYDLSRDPGELRNLAASRPDEVRSWRSRLESTLRIIGMPDSDAGSPMDAEQRARLESLGYVSSGGTAAGRRARPDPKRLVAQHEKFLEAKSLVSRGRLADALARLREVLEADPGNPAALALSGVAQFSMGKRQEGLARMQSAVQAAPGVYENQRNLANALHVSGRLDEAASAYRAALSIQPSSAESHFGLGNVLLARQDTEGAVSEYRKALSAAPSSPQVLAALGSALDAKGDGAGAEQALRQALQADPGMSDAWNRLGVVLEKSRRPGEARQAYERALELAPDDAGALFNHAKVCLAMHDVAAARRSAERLRDRHPEDSAGLVVLARVELAQGDRDGARALLREFLARPDADPRLVAAARAELSRLEDRTGH